LDGLSPILANIYLHELDSYAEMLTASFTKGKVRKAKTEYKALSSQAYRLNKVIKQEENPITREQLLNQKRELQGRLLAMPYTDQHDPAFRRLTYCRYADDFVLGAICPKSEAEEIFRKIESCLRNTLKLPISQTKSGIKHHSKAIRFLGYDITIGNTDKIVKTITEGQHCKRRTCKGIVRLTVPNEKMKGFSRKHGYGSWETLQGIHRPLLAACSDAEIALQYSAELRGFAQYYALASNFSSLYKLRYLWMQSFLKTMGNKHQTSVKKMAAMLNRGGYHAVRVTGKEGKRREYKLFRLKDVKRESRFDAEVDKPPLTFKYTSGSELLKRIDANKCEYCEREGGYFEVHHVRKLANIKNGTKPWERLMIARKRKTLVLCVDCHHKLTKGKLPDRRHLLK
jgi:RNA-directed DNA polymerase